MCVKLDDALFVVIVCVLPIVKGSDENVGVDARGIVGNAIEPLAEILKPRPDPTQEPLMLSVPVPVLLWETVTDPVNTVSVVKLYNPVPLLVVHPVQEKEYP